MALICTSGLILVKVEVEVQVKGRVEVEQIKCNGWGRLGEKGKTNEHKDKDTNWRGKEFIKTSKWPARDLTNK